MKTVLSAAFHIYIYIYIYIYIHTFDLCIMYIFIGAKVIHTSLNNSG